MATVINNPPAATSDTGNGTGFLVAVILLAVLAFAFFYYGAPALRSLGRGASSTSGVQFNVPDKVDGKVDVNVNQAQPGQGQSGQ
jgi:hypothetical protein